MSSFADALRFTVEHEGGYSYRADDPGGETYCGISRRSNPSWPGWQILDPLENKHVTTPELDALVGELYRKDYWEACGCDKLPFDQAMCLFDFAVHSGVSKARSVWAQLPMRNASALLAARSAFLATWLARFPQFRRGIENRLNDLARYIADAREEPPMNTPVSDAAPVGASEKLAAAFPPPEVHPEGNVLSRPPTGATYDGGERIAWGSVAVVLIMILQRAFGIDFSDTEVAEVTGFVCNIPFFFRLLRDARWRGTMTYLARTQGGTQ